VAEHEHQWKGRLFADGCHHFSNTSECECGALMNVTGERIFWLRGKMQPGIYMALEGCERCHALEMGARRKPTRVSIREPGGPWQRVLRDGRVVEP